MKPWLAMWFLVETSLLMIRPEYTPMKSELGCYLAGMVALNRGSTAECQYFPGEVPDGR